MDAHTRAIDAIHLTERLKWEGQEYWLHLETKGPLEKYPAKQHARRVQEKLGVEDGLIYLPGVRARNNEDSDMPAPFRQRRYFYYLSGCNEPNCHLTYDIQHDTLSLFIPRINPERVIWNGRGSTPAEALDQYDIDEVYFIDELQDFIQDWCKFYRGNLFILHEDQNPLIPGLHEPIDSTSLQPAMNLARVVKDEHEINLIRKANNISSQAHREVLANILKFKNEAQVEGLFLNVCISKQAKEQAYDPIAASGPNAGTLHYDANNEDFGDRQVMCLDAGCEYQLYASDITRTFPLSPSWPSVEAHNIYKLVQRMQETCIERLAPGVRYLDLHILAHQIAIDGLLQLGILYNGTREEIYKAGTSRAFFPHGLGHHVGLEVHDVGQGDLMSMTKGNPFYERAPSLYPENFHLPVYNFETCFSPTDPMSGHLEAGMVVTVEPGIYFSTYALAHFYLPSPVHSKFINVEVVNRYLPVGGVRIEDDILITSKGYDNLTTAPKGEDMLKIIRASAKQRLCNASGGMRYMNPNVQQRMPAEEDSLIRAPGISRHTPEPILKPITRASTAPIQRSKDRKSVDFEPFEGPSLFSNFSQSMPAEKNLQRGRQSQPITRQKHSTEEKQLQCQMSTLSINNDNPPVPVCGERSTNVIHAYMDFPSTPTELKAASAFLKKKPNCKNCMILVQTVDRLRQNLNLSRTQSEQGSPILEQHERKPRVEPAAKRELKSVKTDLRTYGDPRPGMSKSNELVPEPSEHSIRLGTTVQNNRRRSSDIKPLESIIRAGPVPAEKPVTREREQDRFHPFLRAPVTRDSFPVLRSEREREREHPVRTTVSSLPPVIFPSNIQPASESATNTPSNSKSISCHELLPGLRPLPLNSDDTHQQAPKQNHSYTHHPYDHSSSPGDPQLHRAVPQVQLSSQAHAQSVKAKPSKLEVLISSHAPSSNLLRARMNAAETGAGASLTTIPVAGHAELCSTTRPVPTRNPAPNTTSQHQPSRYRHPRAPKISACKSCRRNQSKCTRLSPTSPCDLCVAINRSCVMVSAFRDGSEEEVVTYPVPDPTRPDGTNPFWRRRPGPNGVEGTDGGNLNRREQ